MALKLTHAKTPLAASHDIALAHDLVIQLAKAESLAQITRASHGQMLNQAINLLDLATSRLKEFQSTVSARDAS